MLMGRNLKNTCFGILRSPNTFKNAEECLTLLLSGDTPSYSKKLTRFLEGKKKWDADPGKL